MSLSKDASFDWFLKAIMNVFCSLLWIYYKCMYIDNSDGKADDEHDYDDNGDDVNSVV